MKATGRDGTQPCGCAAVAAPAIQQHSTTPAIAKIRTVITRPPSVL
jgi:hypothetical protein